MWSSIKTWLAKRADILERGLWTALQVLTAGAVVEFFELDVAWAVPIATVLAFIKGALAAHFGNGTASTLPTSLEPVPNSVMESLMESVQADLETVERFATEDDQP